MITLEGIEKLNSKNDFCEFLSDLRNDFQQGDWENVTLADFLQALHDYTMDIDGFYSNIGKELPKQGDWQCFATLLAGARIYE